MNPTVIATIVSIVAIVIALYSVYRAHEAGTPITGELLTDSLTAATETAQEIEAIVKAGVLAAEQLKQTGRLPDNNAAFDYAFNFAKKLLPNLDKATLTTFIESAVPIANALTEQIKASQATPAAPTSDAPPPRSILGR